MAFRALKVVAVEQAGDTLTALFNDGRSVAYSISMLDSEFEEIQGACGGEPVLNKPTAPAKRTRVKTPPSKRPVAARLLRPLNSRKAS